MKPRIHDWYLLKQFVKVFFISVLSFTIIYVTIDIFEEIDNFIDHDASLKNIFLYYVYSVPFILTYIVPVSLLLGTIFSMGIMARRNELTAFIASGISLLRVAMPILIAALFVSVASMLFNDLIVTKANRKVKDLKRHEIEGRTRSNPMLKENLHYLGEGGVVYLASRYNHNNTTLYEVVVQQFDRNTLTRRIDAKRAAWKDGQWIFYSGFDRAFQLDSENVRAFEELTAQVFREPPGNFMKKEIDQENMNIRELSSYIERIRNSGGSVERYLTDLHFKFSYPFAGSIFVLLGIAFVSGKRKQSIATGFGVTLSISFIYYGFLRIGQTLGYNGVLPPLFAAQLGNILFLTVGTVSITKANH
jgi:lipopolysaccharide export system permease protein